MELYQIEFGNHPVLAKVAHRSATPRTWALSSAGRRAALGAQLPHVLRRRLAESRAERWDPADVAALDQRLFVGTAGGYFSDPLPVDVRAEVRTRLAANPALQLEYVGRGTVVRYPDGEARQQVAIDIPGGRRGYHFRALGPNEEPSPMSPGFSRDLAELSAWLDDPGAKVVVSIGGGGYRAFAVTPILKMLDLAAGNRSRIDEVWGCSGGAVAAHVYADGFTPDALDELGYTIYHRRDLCLPDFSVPSVANLWVKSWMRPGASPTLHARWLERLEALQPIRAQPRIPFFATAANPSRRSLFALTDRATARRAQSPFIVAAERSQALAASGAVPMLFPPQRGIAGRGDVWVDGGLVDENPLALPFAQWARERARGDGRPRLKLFLIDLNARSSESMWAKRMARLPVVGRFGFKRAFRQVDMLLDSRSELTLEMMTHMPDVQVYRARLHIHAFAVRDRPSVIKAILGGRRYQSWRLSRYGGGFRADLVTPFASAGAVAGQPRSAGRPATETRPR